MSAESAGRRTVETELAAAVESEEPLNQEIKLGSRERPGVIAVYEHDAAHFQRRGVSAQMRTRASGRRFALGTPLATFTRHLPYPAAVDPFLVFWIRGCCVSGFRQNGPARATA